MNLTEEQQAICEAGRDLGVSSSLKIREGLLPKGQLRGSRSLTVAVWEIDGRSLGLTAPVGDEGHTMF